MRLVLTFLEMSIIGMFDVVESRVRFLIIENLLLICTVNVDSINCAKCFSVVPFTKQIGKAKCPSQRNHC